MTVPAEPGTPKPDTERDRRRQEILDRLRSRTEPLLERMADTLVDAPDEELFRGVELEARDLGRRIAREAQQAGLDDRKKGAT